MEKPISVVEQTQFANIVTRVVVERDGKYLMVQEGKPYIRGLWAFPGGKLDVGEMLTVSAVREIREETGVEVELVGVIGLQYFLWDDRPGFTYELDLLGRAVSIPDTIVTSEEILDIAWKTKEEIHALEEGGKLRNKGHATIAKLLAGDVVLPISAVIEGNAQPPAEVA